MIPLGTYNNPTRRRAYLTYTLILINILVFLWELRLPQQELSAYFFASALMPCRFIGAFTPGQVLDIFRSMFLHVDFWHLAGNMIFLWIFATNVEDFLGRRWFLALYFLGGIVAALVHTVLYNWLCIPIVGASGAVAAVLGAYFVLYPGTRVRVGIPFLRFFILPITIPAYFMLGLWFLLQILNSMVGLASTTMGGVAFFAHIGGFMFGLLLAILYTNRHGAPEQVVYPD
jgi:membrane associated rhomboid family serine protease